jgi:hypothetical protein
LCNSARGEGRAFQFGILQDSSAERGYLYPALWVESSIFEADTYTVKYEPNFGTGAASEYKVPQNSDHTVNNPGFAYPGYSLSYYTTEKNGGGVRYNLNQTLKVTGDLTLYAQWASVQQFTVTYKANNGTGAEIVVNVTEGQQYTIAPNSFISSGNFSSWNTEPDGSGTRYRANQQITITESLILNAQWIIVA